MFCHKCGNPAITGAAFCQYCGEKLLNEEIAADTFNIILTDAGTSKVSVAKAIHEWTELGLQEVLNLLEKVPVIIKESTTREEAEFIKRRLTKAGAAVSFTNKDGQLVDIIIHCKSCGAVLDDGDDLCKSCGCFLEVPAACKKNYQANYIGRFRTIADNCDWKELQDEFMTLPKKKKIFILLGLLFAVGVGALILIGIFNLIFFSPITLIVIPAGGFLIYQLWGANYVTILIYNMKSTELQLPEGMTAQKLVELLRGRFDYPYFNGVRCDTMGMCLIEGRYAAYSVAFGEDDRAFLNCDYAGKGKNIRVILREAIAVRSYINKFFNPMLPINTEKDLKALKSAERKHKVISLVLSAATVLLVAVIVMAYVFPGSLQRIAKPGIEVREAYLTQYSNTVTVEEAFENFFKNGKWSTYKERGYSYVVFTGECEYLGEPADVRVTFKITGEQFIVDSLDVNGQTQNDIILYGLLSKVYENY